MKGKQSNAAFRSFVVVVAVILLAVFAGSVNAKPIKIRFSHVVAPNTPKGKAADMFAKLANERLKVASAPGNVPGQSAPY